MNAESDLLASLLTPQPPYPWEPLNPESEPYFECAIAELDDPAVEASITAGWQRFSTQLTDQWSPRSLRSRTGLQAITAQFQERLPADVLQTLATTAASVARSSQSLMDQLVTCASAVLPTWDQDDLTVLARPLAYALRDGQNDLVDMNLRAIPPTDWSALSEVEQARLSLVIAFLALKAAKSEES